MRGLRFNPNVIPAPAYAGTGCGGDPAKNMNKQYHVYIMAKARNSTFYVGITSDLRKRVWEHKNEAVEGFTQKYGIKNLVYYETFDNPENAIAREKRLKKWNRTWKMRIIEEMNPDWKDLYEEICK
jgi:putative endonuclease